MSDIMSTKIYSPSEFVEIMTGRSYIMTGDNDVEAIHRMLKNEGVEDEEYPIFDYPLDEIDEIMEADTYVVLVDCLVLDDDEINFRHEYRWFECGDDFEGKEQEYNEKYST